eukprot:SAG11_NODE_1372_length_5095_cov_15.640312_1_plen_677_part_00
MLAATVNLTLYITSSGGDHPSSDFETDVTSPMSLAYSPKIAADALGAASLLAEEPHDASSLTQQLTVEVNTLWAPFATECTLSNSSQITASWTCTQPAVRGSASAQDSVTCDCDQHSMMYPLATFQQQCACHRMLELAVGRLDLNRSAASMLANDSVRSARKALRGSLGGFRYSLPPLGHCDAGSDTPCTWRIISAGPSANTSCLIAALKNASGRTATETAWLAGFANGSECASTRAVAERSPAGDLMAGAAIVDLYRLAPASLAVDLVNANSGDLAGDVFFGVMEAQLQCYELRGRRFSCNQDPMNERNALRRNDAVYTRFTTEVNTLWSDYTMCNAREDHSGYTCVPEWNCGCVDALGGTGGGGGEQCGCLTWGSGSMHMPPDTPDSVKTSSVGVGRNDVESEWGTTGGGHNASDCSAHHSPSGCNRGCSWNATARACANTFDAAVALTKLADLVRGQWFSTQAPGQNRSWRVQAKAVSNATCVNSAVNRAVDRAGAAACRRQRHCPGDGSYPLDGEERNCWIECFASTVAGGFPGAVTWDGAPVGGMAAAELLKAFELAFTSEACRMPVAASDGPLAASFHTYTHKHGALPGGSDAIPPVAMSLVDAEAKCSSLANCIGITFKSTNKAPSGVIPKVYFKDKLTIVNADPAYQVCAFRIARLDLFLQHTNSTPM